MRADDKDIVETLKACPENGFRMLMAKYQEAVYWHIRGQRIFTVGNTI